MSTTTGTAAASSAATSVPRHARVLRLLDTLGIRRAHFAGRHPAGGMQDLHGARPDLVASMTLVGPDPFDPRSILPLGDRVLVIHGDGGPAVAGVRRGLTALPDAVAVELRGHESFFWSDTVAERTGEVAAAMEGLLDRVSARDALPPAALPEGEGEVDGISYRVRGEGPPLVLFPLSLAPTQWDALVPRLATRFCTITLGGAHLGAVAFLEERGQTWGYLEVVGGVVDALGLRPGQHVLEVGCGTGVLCRWLARRTGGAIPVVGLDLSPYLLREAAALAAREGLADRVTFREGNAEALPFDDASFEAVLCATVLEEVDADRALAEMVRVTKPGGSIGLVVRALDIPHWFNLPLRPAVKEKAERAGAGSVDPRGCADGSLFRRLRAAGVAGARSWPQLATLYPGRDAAERWAARQQAVLAALSADEADEWRAAVSQAQADGTLCWAYPYHCAVGTRP